MGIKAVINYGIRNATVDAIDEITRGAIRDAAWHATNFTPWRATDNVIDEATQLTAKDVIESIKTSKLSRGERYEPRN